MQASESQSPLLTKREAAKFLRKTPRTVEEYCKRGFISHLKIGRSVLFKREQLLADLERFSVGTKGDL